ncbi:unnamed protein product [Cuscuta epithymum]|uniref:Uncharacterized protein n=1 Tax=Cuscuta epithymum TaxID=186058 RepID=A0AAV0DZ98_9ASTE|nr:unnamed protein product [Cuscuta epithymum]
MDHQLRWSPAYSIKRFGLVEESDGAFPTDSGHVINYINQMLLGEDVDENNVSLFCDPTSLRAAENYFHEALGENPSFDSNVGRPEDILAVTSSSNVESSVTDDSVYSFGSANSVPSIFFDDEIASILKSPRGVEEARRFIPAINPMVINFDDQYSSHPETEDLTSGSTMSRVGKHYRPGESGLDEEVEEDERRRKQSAAYKEEVELSEVFDKVLLLCADENDDSPYGTRKQQQKGRKGGKRHSNKKGCEVINVDLQVLLINCAKSIAAADYGAAVEQLKKIRQYSSPVGNENQRVAHTFANALEARLAGTTAQVYPSSSYRNTIVVSELLKSHLSSSMPFLRIYIFFANEMIYEAASKGTSLHVIDFGILHGIQWPTLIRDLSRRPGGPPKLRITGIELPQPGFRPSQMVVETGCRLAKYCERFGVPFEYNALTTKNWEAIKVDDLKLVMGEVVAVNCIDRLKRLLDETVCGPDCPRDAVLNLIREVNPHIFVHASLSASHNSPFFVNRFKSALIYYSALFDIFEAVFPRHDSKRMHFEQEFFGLEIANIVACEGMERLERPETYKQWQSRTLRAGFKPVPVNPEIVKKLREKMSEAYHKDFMLAEDGHWILQGWKGRILSGSAAWVTHKR